MRGLDTFSFRQGKTAEMAPSNKVDGPTLAKTARMGHPERQRLRQEPALQRMRQMRD
jgi:hypothetical protein